MRLVLDEGETDDRPSGLPEVLQCVLHEDAISDGVVEPGGRRLHVGVVDLVQLLTATRAHPEGVRDGVTGDPDKPGGQRTPLGIKALSPAPCRHEDLLGDVLGVLVIAETAKGEGVDESRMQPVRVREGVGITIPKPGGHQLVSHVVIV